MKREGQITVHSENMFPIIKKWLYSDKDIFLRELVANGCDAISKLERLRGIGEAPSEDAKPRINIVTDKEKRQLIIEDNGIGMTEEEVEKYITQVAFSGAEDFLEKYKDKTDENGGIIGHFGLGFYSAFMVAETVEIETLSYREGAAPVHWSSAGVSSYEIGDGARQAHGTSVILNVSEDEEEFLEPSRIREILRKYCAFMPVEIFLNPQNPDTAAQEEPKQTQAEDGQEAAAEPPADIPVNNTQPLWKKAPKDCTDEEYKRFYSEVFLDFTEPLFWIHLNVDYPFNLKGILYFPRLSNKVELVPGEVKLYCNQVYVADNIKEVIPEFLMLLKGVIDCPDLPLNVSRSFLQNDGDVAKIAAHITKKVSDKLHAIFKDERETYEQYWEDLAPFIKYGCIRDEKFYDRVKDILLLKTINGSYVPLLEYPKTADNQIFYVSDETMQSQYIRMFQDLGMNAVILPHVVDNHFISFIEYKEKEIRFARIDSDISGEMKADGETVVQTDLIDKFKAAAGRGELTVKTEKLKAKDVPAVILLPEYARRMQDMSKLYGQELPGGHDPETTIVLNTGHPLVQAIPSLSDEDAKLVCGHLYDLAIMSHKPLSAQEMAEFVQRNVKLLSLAAGLEKEKDE